MSSSPWLKVESWFKQYGPIITLRLGHKKLVFIGGYKAAVDIMERQGQSTADRPDSIAAGELLTGGLSLPLAHHGDRFRRMRRAMHTHLQPAAAAAYHPLQSEYAKKFVMGLLDDPHHFEEHARSMKIAYGKTTPTSVSDPEVIRAVEGVDMVLAALKPGAYMVDIIPWLKYIPWYGRELREHFRGTMRLFSQQLGRVENELEEGSNASHSFGRYLLENQTHHGLSEDEALFLAGVFFAAGFDTTMVVLCTMIVAAARFPEEQRKVQDELDAVIGSDRAPTFADRQSLPRVVAFISETQRWRPLVPMGMPHSTTKDVIWENYIIPAGTTVFGHQWSIGRDPEIFPDPHTFKPDRWLDAEGRFRDDLKFFPYGFGRRACPGQHVANNSLFVNTALMLWGFRFARDPMKPWPDMSYMQGIPPEQLRCKIDIQPRLPEAKIRRAMEDYPSYDNMV
ncbi:cytochrome P450 [Suillus paluster]|uniref:cytochrome P450 n=1 Tax=Suillus paluster TaxID=48578 RepID=UPI001B872EB4|nr:cytochrome P450 [Suillus paluster]KAG1744920.1 cytochrome P450 [Suillus paluster]